LRTKHLYILYFSFIALFVSALFWFRFVWLPIYSVKAYTSEIASFQASQYLQQLSFQRVLAKPLVVHFVDYDCPCAKYSLPYIDELVETRAVSLDNFVLSATANLAELPPPLRAIFELVPASPAVAIWNSDGELAYFGPYSSGAYCGDGEDMVLYILDSLAQGNRPQWVNQEAQGCLCEWPRDMKASRTF